ncbi:unnamed protein product [Cylindrotheca closterium]|uniref:Uncharacterized protein n=1 Tax=Cylindrotheca closterium TaxID=2856 RepID=A0AAD2PWB5_9STRA|nr:unnamed protein product [Cylindrotheca closterium]
MLLMNEFFAKLSQDAGVTEISIVSDGAITPRSCASRRQQPHSTSPSRRRTNSNTVTAKKDGKQQKFVPSQQHTDSAPPSYPSRNRVVASSSIHKTSGAGKQKEYENGCVEQPSPPSPQTSRWHDSSKNSEALNSTIRSSISSSSSTSSSTITSTTRPGFEASIMPNRSASATTTQNNNMKTTPTTTTTVPVTIQPPMAPRRKQSIDETLPEDM